jgi:hypothetical protein
VCGEAGARVWEFGCESVEPMMVRRTVGENQVEDQGVELATRPSYPSALLHNCVMHIVAVFVGALHPRP